MQMLRVSAAVGSFAPSGGWLVPTSPARRGSTGDASALSAAEATNPQYVNMAEAAALHLSTRDGGSSATGQLPSYETLPPLLLRDASGKHVWSIPRATWTTGDRIGGDGSTGNSPAMHSHGGIDL
jgi:hypothetical protein